MLSPYSRRFLLLITGLVALGPLSTDLYLPALPGLPAFFHTSVAQVQLTLSIFLLGFAVSQLVYGPLSDRFGRRPVILGGVALYALASLACAFAHSIEALIMGRFVQALGACCGPVLGRAMVRDIHEREQATQMLGYIGAAMAVAPAIAPLLGGYLTLWLGWQANFVLLAIFGVLWWFAVWFGLSETNQRCDPQALQWRRLLRNYGQLLSTRCFVSYTMCSSMVYAGLFAFISGSSFVFIDYFGVKPEHFGALFGCIVIGFLSGTLMVGHLSVRWGSARLLPIGVRLVALSGLVELGLAQLGFNQISAVLVPMVVYMAGMGVVMPSAMAAAITPFPHMAGAASALMGFIQMSIAASVGYWVGHGHDGTPWTMIHAIGVMGLGTWVSYAFRPRTMK